MKLIDIKGMAQPDPYIVESNGVYYIYCTGVDGVHCYKGENLFDGWQHLGVVLSVKGQKEYWAPSVIERNGKFFMYYSSMPEEADDVHLENIKVAVCDRPDGQFAYVKDLLPPFSIDAHVVENNTGLYIFYSVNDYEADRAGTYIAVDKLLDEYTPAGEVKAVVRPTIAEEIYEKDRFRKGQDWYTIEGAFYFKKDGVHYCIYSANSYLKSTYHLGYAYCTEGGDELNRLNFEKASPDAYAPLLCGNGEEISTGHNSMIEKDGKMYLVYHGRDADSDLSCDDRTARICELAAESGELKVKRIG